jgi:glycyl-tRNA synthetase (class II)
VDVQTVGDDKAAADDKVTIRDRDTMQQIRVPIQRVPEILVKLMEGAWAEVAANADYKIPDKE